MIVLKSSGQDFQRFNLYEIIRRKTPKPTKANNLLGGGTMLGKEQRPPEPGVNLSSFYDTSDLLKTASRVGAVTKALPQASSSFALAHCNRSEAHSGNRPKRHSS